MTMRFSSILKGRNAETNFVALLEQAGYCVARIGVEVLVDPVKRLDYKRYRALALPVPLRAMPDLLVTTADTSKAYMVEVKFRRAFDAEAARELYDTLRVQRENWPDAYAAILLSSPIIQGGRFHQDYIRILPLADVNRLVSRQFDGCQVEHLRMRAIWEGLPQLQDVFRYFYQSPGNRERGRQGQQNADFVTRFLRQLAA
jgi:hypothetical protein